jgi:hypothetical protein
MKKLYSTICLLLACYSFSQNFPYLNASTGNPDFFTDADTNMYFIHGNRLAKVDKNFQPVWANTYGNFILKNVLLSKTNSLYFIGGTNGTVIGKFHANGNLAWIKSTAGMVIQTPNSGTVTATLNCNNFFLDSK